MKTVGFVIFRMSYVAIRGRWYHTIALNAHAPTEDKSEDLEDNFCEGLGQILDQFLITTSKFCWETSVQNHWKKFLNRQGGGGARLFMIQ
jgi:hypothetical protein